jgi:hypothetical protein
MFQIFEPQNTGMLVCISANNILQYFPCQKCQCSYATTVDDVQVSQSVYVQQSHDTQTCEVTQCITQPAYMYIWTREKSDIPKSLWL